MRAIRREWTRRREGRSNFLTDQLGGSILWRRKWLGKAGASIDRVR